MGYQTQGPVFHSYIIVEGPGCIRIRRVGVAVAVAVMCLLWCVMGTLLWWGGGGCDVLWCKRYKKDSEFHKVNFSSYKS